MIYRVVLKVSYLERWFDFEDAVSACSFATKAMEHHVNQPNEDEERNEVYIKLIKKED